jgi:hypothetical protein
VVDDNNLQASTNPGTVASLAHWRDRVTVRAHEPPPTTPNQARRNRVAPTGHVISAPGRGLFLGNRGCIHNDAGEIVRWQATKTWIICELDFPGTLHPLFEPRRYTHLFFLDEASALAAGHRPCHYCRRSAALAFADAWRRAGAGPTGSMKEINEVLAGERPPSASQGRVWSASLAELAHGVFVETTDGPCLWWQQQLYPWSAEGYGAAVAPGAAEVLVLTPPSTAATIAAGYQPTIHPSARPA